jgi:hypothetical protein
MQHDRTYLGFLHKLIQTYVRAYINSPKVELEESSACLSFGQGDVYSLCEPPPHGFIQFPRQVCGCQQHHSTTVMLTG